MFIKKDMYFASYEVKSGEMYLFAVGVPDGDIVNVSIYAGSTPFSAFLIYGTFLTDNNQSSFEQGVNEVLESLGRKLSNAYFAMLKSGTRLI